MILLVLVAILYVVGIGVYAGVCYRMYERNPDGLAGPLGVGASIWPIMMVVIPVVYAVTKIGRQK